VIAPGVGALLDCEGFEVGVCVVGVDVAGGVVVGVAVVVVGAAAVVAGTVVFGAVGEPVFVAVGEGAVVAVVGAVVGVVVTPLFATVKFPRRLEVVPFDQVSIARMLCDPSVSFVVSYGSAVPSAAAPAKSNGGSVSVRAGGFVRREPSR
jgi:hypothetical protein